MSWKLFFILISEFLLDISKQLASALGVCLEMVLALGLMDCTLSCLQGFAEAFLDHLWKILQDPNNPAVIRQTAGNYIGSFLARAKFIPVV